MSQQGKKRKYSDEYLKFGFTSLNKGDFDIPQCVICLKTLSNDAMRPTRMKRHLTGNHPELAEKPEAYFATKRDSLKKQRLDGTGAFQQQSAKVVETSYELSLMIAKAKKPHNIGETLVKPCILRAAKLLLPQESYNKLTKISLSDSTVKNRIDEMAEDIKIQVAEKVKSSPVFAIQCDETTDISHCSQLLVYTRFIWKESVEEDMLFCCPLETSSTANDVFEAVSNFFQAHDILWEKLIGVCTDGAPAMLGTRSGFVTKVKERAPSAISTHCFIHRQALAAKTLPDHLKQYLNIMIKIVNHIKHSALNTRLFAKLCQDLGTEHETLLFHTNVRWLSKGNMLGRLYELRDEVTMFLEIEKSDYLASFKSEEAILSLAYLADIFEALNALNRQLQGRDASMIAHCDAIRTFIGKVQLWKCRIQKRNTTSFPRLHEIVNENLSDNLKAEIEDHLQGLENEFHRYFPNNSDSSFEFSLARNPFSLQVETVPEALQEEFLELKFNSVAKDDFTCIGLEKFWIKYLPVYKKISQVVLPVIVPFSSTYLCEIGFSALVGIKTKQRNKLDVESDLRCALSQTPPNIPRLVGQKSQHHPSH